MLLFIVGYMGCGKTTVGRRIARRIGVRFEDTDAIVERRECATISDVFAYEGEEHFRELEREAIEGIITEGGDVVVSTGGGLPLWRDNMDIMNAAGTTVYIRRSPRNIASRLSPYGRQKRPRLRGLDDEELLEFMTSDMSLRNSYYMKAKYMVNGDIASDDDIVEDIIKVVLHHE